MSLAIPTLQAAILDVPPLVLDRFNRADSTTTLGTAETGQAWTAWNGTWGISGNQAYLAGTGTDPNAVIDTGTTQVIVTCDVSTSNTTFPSDLSFRGIDLNNHLLVELAASAIDFYKRDVGTYTKLATVAFTTSNNVVYRLKVRCNGAVIEMYVDDVLKITHTLTGADATKFAGATATYAGLRAGGVSPGTQARWDNFRVTRL